MISNTKIYTDGSCNTRLHIGACVAIFFVDDEKIVLSETFSDTTHQRMELAAPIMALNYILQHFKKVNKVELHSDSQYVAKLKNRADNIALKNYITSKGNEIRNIDLIKRWIQLNKNFSITTIKMKAHQKMADETQYNIEADKLSRKLVRGAVNKMIKTQNI